MNETEKIGLHSIYLLVGNIIIALLSFGITAFITRKLGPSDYGIYSFVISAFAFLSPMALLSTSSILVRNISIRLMKKEFNTMKGYLIAITKIVLYSTSIIAFLIALIAIEFPNFLVYPNFILLYIPYFFFGVLYDLLS